MLMPSFDLTVEFRPLLTPETWLIPKCLLRDLQELDAPPTLEVGERLWILQVRERQAKGVFADMQWSHVKWDRTTSALLDPSQPRSLDVIFGKVTEMVLELVMETGTATPGDRYMVPGGAIPVDGSTSLTSDATGAFLMIVGVSSGRSTV